MNYRIIRQRISYLFKGNAQGVSMGYMSKSGSTILPTLTDLLSKFPLISQDDLLEGQKLYTEVVNSHSGSIYPHNYDSGMNLNSFLYAYIKAYAPKVVVETGVANGITTNIILRALGDKGSVLHSFDIDNRARNSYSGGSNWIFHLLTAPFHKSLRSQVAELNSVDLWLHDSNHGGVWQSYEYSLAVSKLSSYGILVSDDVDASTAWAQSINALSGENYILYDLRKVIGIHIQVNPERN